jgi:hypothetical protein
MLMPSLAKCSQTQEEEDRRDAKKGGMFVFVLFIFCPLFDF